MIEKKLLLEIKKINKIEGRFSCSFVFFEVFLVNDIKLWLENKKYVEIKRYIYLNSIYDITYTI